MDRDEKFIKSGFGMSVEEVDKSAIKPKMWKMAIVDWGVNIDERPIMIKNLNNLNTLPLPPQ